MTIRYGIIDGLEFVMAIIRNPEIQRYDFFGQSVKVSNSVRLMTFAKKGITCVFCGQKASFFAVEKNGYLDGSPHLNLYGYDEKGRELLFTKDHKLPKSKGGSDGIRNMQCACTKCNSAKGNNADYVGILGQKKKRKK